LYIPCGGAPLQRRFPCWAALHHLAGCCIPGTSSSAAVPGCKARGRQRRRRALREAGRVPAAGWPNLQRLPASFTHRHPRMQPSRTRGPSLPPPPACFAARDCGTAARCVACSNQQGTARLPLQRLPASHTHRRPPAPAAQPALALPTAHRSALPSSNLTIASLEASPLRLCATCRRPRWRWARPPGSAWASAPISTCPATCRRPRWRWMRPLASA